MAKGKSMVEKDKVLTGWETMAGMRQRFEESLLRALEPQKGYLTDLEYETYVTGKMLRPLLLFLTACASTGTGGGQQIPDKAVKAAVSLEMLHMATLIHDDIIDDAARRRGKQSVFAARGRDMALLIGDLQFIQAIRVFAADVETKSDMRLVEMVLDVGFRICTGEIDEYQQDRQAPIEELRNHYFRVIERKTAVLFRLACEVGATMMGGRKRAIYQFGQFGLNFGLAFQIMDDIFDFLQPEEVAGKEPNSDVARRTLTLPIINAMEDLGEDHHLTKLMRNGTSDEGSMKEAIDAVVASDGLVRAYSKARLYAVDAVALLDAFPDSPELTALTDLAYYIVDRGFDSNPKLDPQGEEKNVG